MYYALTIDKIARRDPARRGFRRFLTENEWRQRTGPIVFFFSVFLGLPNKHGIIIRSELVARR